uniref:Uncharacterized protein n=1 Tax=Dunaliella tertiolecta TaxID=3047 RepID=A0A6S8I3A1_DUNTE|mmetsp:Transcript_17302/g.47963  ORF Transcript_17302/g.47963 Transcript_17302/m.47963 type:complete len:171 (+) Transcript_17302:263-775(+)
MLTPSKQARLRREGQDHMRETPEARAIVADGNASSIRSRCSCLNSALERGEDALLEHVSNPDVVFYHRFCENTPALKEPLNRCKPCLQQNRQPAHKDAAPGNLRVLDEQDLQGQTSEMGEASVPGGAAQRDAAPDTQGQGGQSAEMEQDDLLLPEVEGTSNPTDEDEGVT